MSEEIGKILDETGAKMSDLKCINCSKPGPANRPDVPAWICSACAEKVKAEREATGQPVKLKKPYPPLFSVGDVVQLKSGGPPMTVVKVPLSDEMRKLMCPSDGNLHMLPLDMDKVTAHYFDGARMMTLIIEPGCLKPYVIRERLGLEPPDDPSDFETLRRGLLIGEIPAPAGLAMCCGNCLKLPCECAPDDAHEDSEGDAMMEFFK